MAKEKKFTEISRGKAMEIVSNPETAEAGRFWCLSSPGNVYVGIDNTTHEAWTEDFKTKKELFDWLNGGENPGEAAEERRLVDIAPLLKELRKEAGDYGEPCEALTGEEAIYDEIDDLENLPVIDPASLRPVAHWVVEKDYFGEPTLWSCSNPECNEGLVLEDGETPEENEYKFCPFCGARMEGRVETVEEDEE